MHGVKSNKCFSLKIYNSNYNDVVIEDKKSLPSSGEVSGNVIVDGEAVFCLQQTDAENPSTTKVLVLGSGRWQVYS